MRFSTYINNQKAVEWGLNANQAALFDLLNQASSWAEEIIVEGVVYYWVSRKKVIEELPLFYKTADTVYRHFSELDEKGLISYQKQGKHGDKDLIRLTEKGKSWNEFNKSESRDNSEINPNKRPKLGNKSEITRKQIRDNSEINPTDNNTNYKNTTDQNNNPLPLTGQGQSADADKSEVASSANKKLSIDYDAIVDEFNQAVDGTPIPKVRVISEQRKKLVLSIAKLFKKQFGNCETETFRGYFDDFIRQANQRRDRFYYGGGPTGWRADFDYILKQQTFVKTYEDAL